MKILLVDEDDDLRSLLAKELKSRAFEAWQARSGHGGLSFYQKNGPWELVLTDILFLPDANIGDGAQLMVAIQEINPFQQMAMMTSDPQGARRNLPKDLRHLPVLRKPFAIEQVLRLLRQPVLPLCVS
jgi:DNA-binding NtrC family response regulator